MRWAAVAAALLLLSAIFGSFYFLSRPAQLASAAAENSIAVLPFVNMSERQVERVFLRRHLRKNC